LFLQEARGNAEIADYFGSYKGNDTFEDYFVNDAGESDTILMSERCSPRVLLPSYAAGAHTGFA
jgi:hypothetical protein